MAELCPQFARVLVASNTQNCRWLLATALAAVLLTTCSTTPPPPSAVNLPPSAGSGTIEEINQSLSIAAAQSTSSPADYRLGPDDLVQVTIYNIPEKEIATTPRTVMLRVSQQGMIVVPLIGEVTVKGKTPGEVEQELATRYSKYIRNPQVGILVTEYRQRASVMGAVQRPGVFELTGPKSVIDLVALAGGITEKAGNQVHVYRYDHEGKRQSIVIDLLALANPSGQIIDSKSMDLVNLAVQPGDVINVPQAGMFFVDGAVHRPGSYPLGRHYTLTQALATAGGADVELADYSEIAIYRRRGPAKVETILVDLEKVRAGNSEDIQVQADDVVIVPMSPGKYFVRRFIGTLIGGFSGGSVSSLAR
jgi:polysaccharide export outer membrane protein